MAKGTTAGLLDEVKPQSVFKHEILNQYILPFATMTGARSEGKRAVLLDGFAGRGRYPGGKAASGEHMLLAAQKSKNNVAVEVVLVEQKRSDFEVLDSVTREYVGRGVSAVALHGDVQDHIESVVGQARDAPLFLFLDPCGANLPFDVLREVLGTHRLDVWPPTEALLNISADLTRRAAGCVNKRVSNPAIEKLDVVCGGSWWQQVALDAHRESTDDSWESAAEAVVAEYASRLGQQCSMDAVVVPVRRRASHQPVYHLVFLTRSGYGLWVFADALAKAHQSWISAVDPIAEDGILDLGLDLPALAIDDEQEQGLELVRRNLLALVDSEPTVTLVERTLDVFGNGYGVVQEKTVRKAVRALAKEGRLVLDSSAKQPRNWKISRP